MTNIFHKVGVLKLNRNTNSGRRECSKAQSCVYQENEIRLKLQANIEGILKCRGRIQGHHLVYLSRAIAHTLKTPGK